MKFEPLKHYIIPSESDSKKLSYKNLKHHLFPITKKELDNVKKDIFIPKELNDFFENIGYGFFHQKNKDSFERLLDVVSFKKINLRQDYYEFDPDLELYDASKYNDKVIFFELNEGVYLLIEKKDNNGKNRIYYFDKKIADSLEEFLIKFDKDPHYFEDNSND